MLAQTFPGELLEPIFDEDPASLTHTALASAIPMAISEFPLPLPRVAHTAWNGLPSETHEVRLPLIVFGASIELGDRGRRDYMV